jgi:hypothetical protein
MEPSRYESDEPRSTVETGFEVRGVSGDSGGSRVVAYRTIGELVGHGKVQLKL